ncbi:MAG: D-alanyl-D-alanine carboxypeptidase family protein [Gammaproteobacteria bacterium]|nr:D-alanyl-D-alanine carboxypeptidase family protein [Gammaproteobacteria bacterium]
MNKLVNRLICILLMLFVVTVNVNAEPVPIPKAPMINAKGYILLDHYTGTVIAENNADERNDPASITKLMTAYVVYKVLSEGSIQLTEEVLISEKAWRAIGSRMFVEVGKRVIVDDLLQGLIVQSGNDASIALAEHIAGSEDAFVGMMNIEAARLGLLSSHFTNVTGLTHEQHFMTARDIAMLSSAIIRDFPDQYKRYSQKEFTFNGITQHNRNKLLWRDPTVDGLKTGHTDAAKYCLASSAKRDDMRLVSVVLGAPSSDARATHSQALLNYGFRFFESHKLYSAGQVLLKKRAWYGAKKEVSLGIKEDITITIPRGRYNDLKPFMQVASTLEAPIEMHQSVGKVVINLDDAKFTEVELVALESIQEGSIMQRISDYIMSYFE